jgi:pimeloyl-ACP methyl ester carboxylesterase
VRWARLYAASAAVGARDDVLIQVHSALQKRLASLSSRSVHVLATTSTHFVQSDNPDLVLAAVRAAVEAVRNGGRLASCDVIFRDVDGRKCLS